MPELPKLDCKWGAPLGRAEARPVDADRPMVFYLKRLRINGGGYEAGKGGAYWGLGAPVFWACEDRLEGEPAELFMRAVDRDAAKARIVARYPNATFHR